MGTVRRTLPAAVNPAAILLLFVASTTVVLLTFVVSPAAGHAVVESSDPPDGAVLQEPVDEITVVFTVQAEPIGDGFQVVESDGEIRTPNGWETPDGRTFVLHFDPPITGGETGMQWSIRSEDSHALTGSFTFTVASGDPSPPVAAVAEAPADDEAATDVEGDTATGPSEALSTDAAATPSAAETNDPVVIESAAVVVDPQANIGDLEIEATPGARLLGLIGRIVVIAGTLLSVGAVVFLVRILRGTSDEGQFVVAVARRASMFIAVGALAKAIAQAVLEAGSLTSAMSPLPWIDLLSSRFGAAFALTMIGAFGLSSGSYFRREALGYESRDVIRTNMAKVGVLAAGPRPSEATNHPPPGNPGEHGASLTPLLYRWHPSSASSGAVLGIVALVAAAVVDGHTLGGSSPLLSAAVTATHVLAGSVWVGGVFILFCLLRRRFHAQRRVEAVDLAVRYSVLAAVSLVGVALAGLILTYTRLESVGQLWTTDWGQLVLAKLALVGVAAALGAANHFFVIPRLAVRTDDVGLGATLTRLISAEIVILVTVVAISAQLVATGLV